MTGRQDTSTTPLLWAVGILAAALGLVRLTNHGEPERNELVASPRTVGLAASAAPLSTGATAVTLSEPILHDGAWTRLSAMQRDALAPLEQVWPTLNETVRRRWLAIASSFASKSRETQDRMHAKMALWSKLSPSQRAEARLRYLQAAKLDAKSKRERWEAYNKMEPGQRPRTQASNQIEVVPPLSVRVRPGATTMMMPQLLGRAQSTDIASH